MSALRAHFSWGREKCGLGRYERGQRAPLLAIRFDQCFFRVVDSGAAADQDRSDGLAVAGKEVDMFAIEPEPD